MASQTVMHKTFIISLILPSLTIYNMVIGSLELRISTQIPGTAQVARAALQYLREQATMVKIFISFIVQRSALRC